MQEQNYEEMDDDLKKLLKKDYDQVKKQVKELPSEDYIRLFTPKKRDKFKEIKK